MANVNQPQPIAPTTQYIVMTASAAVSCSGHYRRVAVLETTIESAPTMISKRARGVVRIVETWERLNVGQYALGSGGQYALGSGGCAYSRALASAREMVIMLTRRDARLARRRASAAKRRAAAKLLLIDP